MQTKYQFATLAQHERPEAVLRHKCYLSATIRAKARPETLVNSLLTQIDYGSSVG